MRALFLLVVAAALGVLGFFWWHSQRYPTKTDQPTTQVIGKGKIEDKITASGKIEYKGGLRLVNVETDGKIISGAKNLSVGKVVQEGEVLLNLEDTLFQDKIRAAEAAITAANGTLKAAQAGRVAAQAKVNSINKELEVARNRVRTLERMREKDVGSEDALKDARLTLEAKEAEGEGAKGLLLKADADIDTANSNIQLAQSQLVLAKRGLEQTLIKAPSSGEIVYIDALVQDSQIVPKGATLLKIAPSPNQWEVKAQISEQDIGRLRTKLAQGPVRASFQTEAYSGDLHAKRYTGKVISIAPLPTTGQRSSLGGLDMLAALGGGGAPANSGPSNYTVTIDVDPLEESMRKANQLYQGFTATDIQLTLNEFTNIVVVPSLALSFKPDGLSDSQQNEINRNEDQNWSTIWLWNNGQYEPRYIKAGASEEGKTHVREVMGGKPEDLLDKQVVTEGPKRPQSGGGPFGAGPIKIPG